METEPLLNQFPDPDPPSETKLWRQFRTRLRYYIPAFSWIPKYDPTRLMDDVIAGATVASLMVPQALSYAQALVQVPPVIGLYSAFVPMTIYALFGTSKQLSVGPEALVSILVGSSVHEFQQWKNSPQTQILGTTDSYDMYSNIQPTALLCLLVGLFTFLLGFFRLGFLDSVLSRALLRGFVLAVACVVSIEYTKIQ